MGIKKKHVPGCGCCGGAPSGPCSRCPGGGPSSVSVTVTGMGPSGCGCDGANTTFILDYQDEVTSRFSWFSCATYAGLCHYVGNSFADLSCGYDDVGVLLQIVECSDGSYEILLSLAGGPFGAGYAHFRGEFASDAVCDGLTAEPLTLIEYNNAGCTFSGASVTVTF